MIALPPEQEAFSRELQALCDKHGMGRRDMLRVIEHQLTAVAQRLDQQGTRMAFQYHRAADLVRDARASLPGVVRVVRKAGGQ